MSEKMIFCLGEKKGDGYQKNYRAFNIDVSEKRYEEILDLIKNNILKNIKLELNENPWKDEWKKVSKEQWKRISEIPEFDKKVVEGIIGFELDLEDDDVEIIVDGKKTTISRKSAKALNLIN